MLRTNEKKLVKISVTGSVNHPTLAAAGYNVGADGVLRVLPGVGGITYNCRVGDPCVGLAADHVEPGVSMRQQGRSNDRQNAALNILACVGNKARVISGDAKGAAGTVTGKHGGIDHVLVDFDEPTKKKMAVGDKIQVEAYGTGLAFEDLAGVRIMNCDPTLLAAMKLKELPGGRIEAPVAAVVPACIMGSGLGHNSCHTGDYDIQMFDEKTVAEYGLGELRFGDIVAITDADHSFGRIYKTGAVSVGVVVHSDSDVSGHGPGVTTLLTSTDGLITPRVTSRANLVYLLDLKKKKPAAKRKKK